MRRRFPACAASTLLLLASCSDRTAPSPDAPRDAVGSPPRPVIERLAAREQRIAETVWADELLAQACGRTVEDFWDRLNRATDALAVAADFAADGFLLPRWGPPEVAAHGIEIRAPQEDGEAVAPGEWRRRLRDLDQAGWRLERTEFRQVRFEVDRERRPVRSAFEFAAHLTRDRDARRAVVDGEILVDWKAGPAGDEPAMVGRVDAHRVGLRTRSGAPPFERVLDREVPPARPRFPVDPLIVQTPEGGGPAWLLLPSVNLAFRPGADGGFTGGALCRVPPGLIGDARLGDFDGDGRVDLLCVKAEGFLLYRGGDAVGWFEDAGVPAWEAAPLLENPMALTCGDVDADGDLDVFLAQYRVPSLGAVLRPSYYDCNDGFPAHLLLNDGRGRFTEATVAAGLGANRHRRTYSASLVDLDADGDPDLAVASDFAGIDLYRNDGRGRFTDVTREWVAEPRAFGMSQTTADFNADGRLDLLLVGMPSATADRLEHLGLERPLPGLDPAMRARMSFGNRLLLARTGGGFEQTGLSGSIARAGWAWGAGAGDFDNDGFPDLYVANGLQTAASVREYEPEFWLHDIFVEESVDPVEATVYFSSKHARTRGAGWSYGGYERNRLFLNRRGESFLEAGHLFGVGLPEDSRCVVATDLDGDGRVDLVVTTYEFWPRERQRLLVFRNRLDAAGHWIGVDFGAAGLAAAGLGAQVTVQAAGRAAVAALVAGDGYRSQRPARLHFGLGSATAVERIEVRWPGGRSTVLTAPAADRVHSMAP